MSKAEPPPTTILNYPRAGNARHGSMSLQAIVLTLPGLLFALFVPLSIWTGWARRIGPLPILLLWFIAMSTSLVSISEYKSVRPKPAHIIACLTVNWCVVSTILAFVIFAFVVLFLDD